MTRLEFANMPRMTSPAAVAMRKRYGNTTSVHRDRRAPRGGQINEQRGYLAEWEEAKEAQEEALAAMAENRLDG
jgi:hypothetical protein